MTGPCTSFLHPCLRRPWLLLPFLASVVFLPMACSDQPTENTAPSVRPTAAVRLQHPRQLNQIEAVAAARASGYLQPEPGVSFSSASLGVGSATGPNVLILADADGSATTALATSLSKLGFQVTLRPAPENTWDGTNPALTDFAVVIHLNGFTWSSPLRAGGQAALVTFVENGGGFIAGAWNGYEATISQKSMPDLVLQGTGRSCGQCIITYNTVPGQESHPVLSGIPSTFTFHADGHDAGAQTPFTTSPSTVLMRLPDGPPAVLVRQFGSGRVVNFSFAPNYGLGALGITLLDPNVQRLYSNAALWLTGWAADDDGDGVPSASDNCPALANSDQADLDRDGVGDACDLDDDGDGVADTADNCPALANPDQLDEDRDGTGDACEVQGSQTIAFAELSGKTFGDADFTVGATASSGLAVSFTAAGRCSIAGATVHLTGVGDCTITAHQSGNTSYSPADEVSRSFSIAKATATLALRDLTQTYTGSPLVVTASTTPAGLSGVSVTYNGSSTPPINAGTYAVTATLVNEQYQAAAVNGVLTINKALATVTVGTQFVYDGAAKQAAITTSPEGLAGVTVTYAQDGVPVPWAINAGTYQVLAHLENPNYQATDAIGSLTIIPATPVIAWAAPAPIPTTTLLGAEQLNASASGVNGISLAGSFVYAPSAGTRLSAGSHVLTVEFIPNDRNYTAAALTVTIQVIAPVSVLRFGGFYAPLKNPPMFNRVRAGRSVPVKFSVEGARGRSVLMPGSPTSAGISCRAVESENAIDGAEQAGRSGLRAEGRNNRYTYIWKTDPRWAGSCRKLVLVLADGSTYEALFRFSARPAP
jgi:hypothetical protein